MEMPARRTGADVHSTVGSSTGIAAASVCGLTHRSKFAAILRDVSCSMSASRRQSTDWLSGMAGVSPFFDGVTTYFTAPSPSLYGVWLQYVMASRLVLAMLEKPTSLGEAVAASCGPGVPLTVATRNSNTCCTLRAKNTAWSARM